MGTSRLIFCIIKNFMLIIDRMYVLSKISFLENTLRANRNQKIEP
jgi:hypothetical protein